MNTIENNVNPALHSPVPRCSHDWQPVEGWQARYQCTRCYVLGRKLRVLTIHRQGGPIGRPGGQPVPLPLQVARRAVPRPRRRVLRRNAPLRRARLRRAHARRPGFASPPLIQRTKGQAHAPRHTFLLDEAISDDDFMPDMSETVDAIRTTTDRSRSGARRAPPASSPSVRSAAVEALRSLRPSSSSCAVSSRRSRSCASGTPSAGEDTQDAEGTQGAWDRVSEAPRTAARLTTHTSCRTPTGAAWRWRRPGTRRSPRPPLPRPSSVPSRAARRRRPDRPRASVVVLALPSSTVVVVNVAAQPFLAAHAVADGVKPAGVLVAPGTSQPSGMIGSESPWKMMIGLWPVMHELRSWCRSSAARRRGCPAACRRPGGRRTRPSRSP